MPGYTCVPQTPIPPPDLLYACVHDGHSKLLQSYPALWLYLPVFGSKLIFGFGLISCLTFSQPKTGILGKDCYSSTPNFCNTLSQQFDLTSGSNFLQEFWVKVCSQANKDEQVVALGIKGLSRSDPQGEDSNLLSPLLCEWMAGRILAYLTRVAGFKRLLRNSEMSPSAGAKSPNYAKIQADSGKCIYDGRWGTNVNHKTVAPPIHIYNPIFSCFYNLLAEFLCYQGLSSQNAGLHG